MSIGFILLAEVNFITLMHTTTPQNKHAKAKSKITRR